MLFAKGTGFFGPERANGNDELNTGDYIVD